MTLSRRIRHAQKRQSASRPPWWVEHLPGILSGVAAVLAAVAAILAAVLR